MTPLKFLLGMLFLKMLFLYEHSSYLKFLICYFYILLWKLSCFIKKKKNSHFLGYHWGFIDYKKKMFITKKKKKNCYNNIRVVTIIDAICYNKISLWNFCYNRLQK